MRYPRRRCRGTSVSMTEDPAAACVTLRLAFNEIGELMLADIDQDTVDWGPKL